MSDPKTVGHPAGPAAQVVDPMEPNLVMYQILKAQPILGADGVPRYAIVGQGQDCGSVINAAQKLGDCAVVAATVLLRFGPVAPTAQP